MIVTYIEAGLSLDAGDLVLDLACGNGALSVRLFGQCAGLVGVDSSEYLIGVANEYFARRPSYSFCVAEVGAYVTAETDPLRFTRVLCYGSFPYFSAATAHKVLDALHKRFSNVAVVYIGNSPDKALANRYYPSDTDFAEQIADHTAQIGIWRTEDEMRQLAAQHHWHARFVRLPPDVFNSRYRYDVILTRGLSPTFG